MEGVNQPGLTVKAAKITVSNLVGKALSPARMLKAPTTKLTSSIVRERAFPLKSLQAKS